MFPNINLIHLKYFHDAARLKSISAGAKENFVSQSAISQGIFNLEKVLQVPLITHQRQKFRLTEEGTLVFRETSRIFSAIENLRNRLRDLSQEISGEVDLACTNAIGQFFLSAKYPKLRQLFPLVQLKLHRGNLHFIHESLRQERFPLAVALDAPEFDGYEKYILAKGYFRFYKAKELKDTQEFFVDHLESPEVLMVQHSYFQKYKRDLKIQEPLSGWGIVSSYVQNCCGMGLLPEFIFSGRQGVEEVDLGIPLVEYAICAFKLKGAVLNRRAAAILENLKT